MDKKIDYTILLEKYPNVKISEINIGYTNKMVLLDNLYPKIVVKIFEKELYKNSNSWKNEINALSFIKDKNISPKLLDYFEDNFNGYLLMEYVEGVNGQTFLDNGNLKTSKQTFKLLGMHLAKDIHSIKLNNNSDIFIIKMINENDNFLDYIPKNLLKLVNRINNFQNKKNLNLIHGDFGPHNIIHSNDSISIVDWEWTGWGNSLQDISNILWFTHLHYPKICKELSDIFINEYLVYNDIEITEEYIKAFSISKCINVLNFIQEEHLDNKKEWIRRLEWTIGHNFL